MRILANDGLDAVAVQYFREQGIEVVTEHMEEEVLAKELGNFDVLILRSATRVNKNLLEAVKGSRLKLILRAGVGVDNIDVECAQKHGFVVKNTPDASSDSVAELVLAHMFALARHIAGANLTMRQGEWNKKAYEGMELRGKTLGILGMGRIGHALGVKAKALGMRVIYYDKYKQDKTFDDVGLDRLLAESDFISVHAPKVDGPLIGKEEIAKMKNGAILINTARGGMVDEESLLEGLQTGKIGGAGIDVWQEEPIKNLALANHPRVSCTPHIGAATAEAQERIGTEIVRIVMEFKG